MKFKHHKYTYQKPFRWESHRWELVGPNGAIHFHASFDSEKGSVDASCGLEYHHKSGEGAPDHINCPLIGGNCWHNGISSYASDYLWPIFRGYMMSGEHEPIFRELEYEYQKHFEGDQ